ncbi:30S ribosomal protein S18 [Streptomyces sp. NPDC050564]|uniref:30S ribosomal protein S18 n=1 Tax=Streptomyces sp. NPDC050564 TaxID=3365631 RepID=UPI0037882F89
MPGEDRPDRAPTHQLPAADTQHQRASPLDAAGITYIDYKNTDLMRKFISDRGKIRSRQVTHVTRQQQRQIAQAIKNAREMALLPYSS